MTRSVSEMPLIKRWWLLFCLIGAAATGCAAGKLNSARDAFYTSSPEQAATVLSETQTPSGRNELLFYMEKGTILHHSGDYQGSTEVLLKATALMEAQDIISASRQGASLVTTEWLTDYKGEYAERLLVHTYLMMNFLLMGKPESALVEAKQALEIFDKYPDACDNDIFTRALIAHCFEVLGEINGAYIEYKKLAQLMGDPTPVAGKLCELAGRLGFYDDVAHYSAYLPPGMAKETADPCGEIVVFCSQGRAPVKIPHDIVLPPSIRFSFSTYESRHSRFRPPAVGPLAGSAGAAIITTDVEKLLNASLKERLAGILLKETARVAAKEAIAHNIENNDAELLVRAIFFLLEMPDTRCWQTLPAYFSLVRVPVSNKDHPIRLRGIPSAVSLPETCKTPAGGAFYQYFSIRTP